MKFYTIIFILLLSSICLANPLHGLYNMDLNPNNRIVKSWTLFTWDNIQNLVKKKDFEQLRSESETKVDSISTEIGNELCYLYLSQLNNQNKNKNNESSFYHLFNIKNFRLKIGIPEENNNINPDQISLDPIIKQKYPNLSPQFKQKVYTRALKIISGGLLKTIQNELAIIPGVRSLEYEHNLREGFDYVMDFYKYHFESVFIQQLVRSPGFSTEAESCFDFYLKTDSSGNYTQESLEKFTSEIESFKAFAIMLDTTGTYMSSAPIIVGGEVAAILTISKAFTKIQSIIRVLKSLKFSSIYVGTTNLLSITQSLSLSSGLTAFFYGASRVEKISDHVKRRAHENTYGLSPYRMNLLQYGLDFTLQRIATDVDEIYKQYEYSKDLGYSGCLSLSLGLVVLEKAKNIDSLDELNIATDIFKIDPDGLLSSEFECSKDQFVELLETLNLKFNKTNGDYDLAQQAKNLILDTYKNLILDNTDLEEQIMTYRTLSLSDREEYLNHLVSNNLLDINFETAKNLLAIFNHFEDILGATEILTQACPRVSNCHINDFATDTFRY